MFDAPATIAVDFTDPDDMPYLFTDGLSAQRVGADDERISAIALVAVVDGPMSIKNMSFSPSTTLLGWLKSLSPKWWRTESLGQPAAFSVTRTVTLAAPDFARRSSSIT